MSAYMQVASVARLLKEFQPTRYRLSCMCDIYLHMKSNAALQGDEEAISFWKALLIPVSI